MPGVVRLPGKFLTAHVAVIKLCVDLHVLGQVQALAKAFAASGPFALQWSFTSVDTVVN